MISSAVLHFARRPEHFRSMLDGSWRLLKRDGLFFCRLASTIGMEGRFVPLGEGRFHLPDGSQRYLVDEAQLLDLAEELGGTLVDPIKTTVAQNQRCMTGSCEGGAARFTAPIARPSAQPHPGRAAAATGLQVEARPAFAGTLGGCPCGAR